MRNAEVAQLLSRIADLLEIKNESPYRIRAYREAARQIESYPEDVADLHREGRLEEIPGVGTSIAAKIAEYLETGKLAYYDQLRQEIGGSAAEWLQVPSIGPVRARPIYEHLGIDTLPELEVAARQHRLCKLPGIGEKTEERILRELGRLQQRTRRLLLGVALPAAERVVQLLRNHPAIQRIEPAGSIRRMRETIGDIDILVASEQPDAAVRAFTTLPIVKEVLASGPTRASILTEENLQIDLRVVHPDYWGSALQYFTGSKAHNIALRDIAIQHGQKLNEYGLFDERTGKWIAGRTEEEIYHALGMDWIPPELRENRGEIEAAQQHRLPHLVTLEDIRGNLHTHTKWSDGTDTLEAMVEAAIALGWEYLAITDHSAGLGVAGGLSVEEVDEQRQVIEALNRRYRPFTILHGTEVNIRSDGTLDYPDEVLARFDFVIAAIHSGFRQSSEQLTRRAVLALRHPLVDAFAHPTGRRIGEREGYAIDLETVLRVAAETGTALEINGQADRLDLDDIWARRAKEMGVTLVLNADAHATWQLRQNVRFAVAVARRAWLEPHNVLNTLSLADLRQRRKVRARAA